MNERFEGGLWCRDVLELLDRYVAGELTAAELTDVTAHVGKCTQCAQFGEAYARVVQALRPEPVEPLDGARLRRLQDKIGAAT